MLSSRRAATLAVVASCLVPVAATRAQTTPPGGAGAGGPRRAAGPATRAARCPVEGAWELVSTSENGRDQPLGGRRQRKLVAGGQFIWVGEEAKRDTLPLRTQLDTLRALRFDGGAGTYTTTRDTYTERMDYFFIPSMLGQSLEFTCRVQGDRWYHDHTYAADTSVAGSRPARVAEVWRRVK